MQCKQQRKNDKQTAQFQGKCFQSSIKSIRFLFSFVCLNRFLFKISTDKQSTQWHIYAYRFGYGFFLAAKRIFCIETTEAVDGSMEIKSSRHLYFDKDSNGVMFGK